MTDDEVVRAVKYIELHQARVSYAYTEEKPIRKKVVKVVFTNPMRVLNMAHCPRCGSDKLETTIDYDMWYLTCDKCHIRMDSD